ncbi:MAG: aminotransferase-like domain-containing protein [Acidimicrobiales bacterium]
MGVFLSIEPSERTGRGIARAVSGAVSSGVLGEGDRLPSIRAVAHELGVSPTTVSAAWGLLARAGAIRTDGRRGTVVTAKRSAGPARYRRALERAAAFELDLSTGVPDPALLPDLRPALRRLDRATTIRGSYLDPSDIPELVALVRSQWPYEPEALVMVDGAMDALDLVASSIVGFGDKVAVEQPCFPPLLDLLEALGAQVLGVAVDDEGLDPRAVDAAVKAGARALFFQPRAQNPTGMTMTKARGAELARVLARPELTIVEDDSAGLVASSAAISMGAWLSNQTVHVRSFSKSHGPDLRLAAMSGPATVLDPIIERRLLGQGWTSRLLQSVLLDLLTDRDARSQVQSASRAYARRRQALVVALGRHGIEVGGTDGLNLWLPVRDEAAALVRLASRGIGAAAGSPFMLDNSGQAHLRVTAGLVRRDFASIADELAGASLLSNWASPR